LIAHFSLEEINHKYLHTKILKILLNYQLCFSLLGYLCLWKVLV